MDEKKQKKITKTLLILSGTILGSIIFFVFILTLAIAIIIKLVP